MKIFDEWCDNAVSKIRYKPDRKMVRQELRDHLDDHYDALIREGYPHQEAQHLALAAVGSPEEIAPQLGAIHRPWLGYLYSVTKWAAIFSFANAVFLLIAFTGSHIHSQISTANYDSLRTEGNGGYYCKPNVSDSSDGYRFTVTEAALNAAGDTLHLELRTTWWPWMTEPAISRYFWAVDDLGNHYVSKAEAPYDDIPKVQYGGSFSSQGFSSQSLEITHFDSLAQWVELRYDRDGRDIVLRIDLNGGGEE